jgi:hypothetical protein
LKFISLGLGALLRGSSEHHEMKLQMLLPIKYCHESNSKFILFDPSKFKHKTFQGGLNQGEPVSN